MKYLKLLLGVYACSTVCSYMMASASPLPAAPSEISSVKALEKTGNINKKTLGKEPGLLPEIILPPLPNPYPPLLEVKATDIAFGDRADYVITTAWGFDAHFMARATITKGPLKGAVLVGKGMYDIDNKDNTFAHILFEKMSLNKKSYYVHAESIIQKDEVIGIMNKPTKLGSQEHELIFTDKTDLKYNGILQ